MKRVLYAALLAALAASLGCADADTPTGTKFLERDALLDPLTCQKCHPSHFQDWSGSMHAYASDDPVFIAMNARGQRETKGELGDFCVKCHAPMAVRDGATKDGLNLAELPAKLKGVTCFFCHTADGVAGSHNDPLHLAEDGVMRGPFPDPVANTAHASSYAALLDRDQLESAKLCGPCHDIATDHGGLIERTFQEWQGSVFAKPPLGATCGQCHMDQSPNLEPIAKAPGVFARRTHSHAMPGVDLALTDFPEKDAQRTKVQSFLDTTIQSALCVDVTLGTIDVIVDNVAAGHGWPSGAAQDRRAWIELTAFAGTDVVYQSGAVADGSQATQLADPDLWLLRDCIFDDKGTEVSMFWEAASFESYTLPAQLTFDQLDPRYYQTHVFQRFPRTGALPAKPDRVTMRVRLQAVGLDVIDDLVASKDLDASVRDAIPTFDVGKEPLVEWTVAKAKLAYSDGARQFTCVTTTSLNFQADKVPAPAHMKCKP